MVAHCVGQALKIFLEKTISAMRLTSAHPRIKSTDPFPIQKCAILCKFKESREWRGGILSFVPQAISPTCAPSARLTEIAEKGHLWAETN